MDNHVLGFGFMLLFIASIWVILLLGAIYRVLKAILLELEAISGKRDRLPE